MRGRTAWVVVNEFHPLPRFCHRDDAFNDLSKYPLELAQSTAKVKLNVPHLFPESGKPCQMVAMGTIKLHTLGAYARKGYLVRVECVCNRVTLIDPMAIMAAGVRSSAGVPRVEELGQRLRCERRGQRPKSVGPGLG